MALKRLTLHKETLGLISGGGRVAEGGLPTQLPACKPTAGCVTQAACTNLVSCIRICTVTVGTICEIYLP